MKLHLYWNTSFSWLALSNPWLKEDNLYYDLRSLIHNKDIFSS